LNEIGSKTAEKNSAQSNRQTDRHYENNGHLAVNQLITENLQCNKCHSTRKATRKALRSLHLAWVVHDAKCIVVTGVCVSVRGPHAYTIARTRT